MLFALIFSFSLQAQDILMTIGDKQITLEEFERIYNKNNSDLTPNQQSPEEYLDLFINFKLKVLEAENRGMDTMPKFIREFNGYKDQLANPYLTDEETREKMIREAYERSMYDINASHILIRMNRRTSANDTLAYYNKTIEIRNRILNGEDFAEVARATSDDPSAKRNGGELGYFTVFNMMYPFENAAYGLKPGELSMPVRTAYGYHLIRLNSQRPAMGQLKVAHIYIATPPEMPESAREDAKKEIYAVSDSIRMGYDFGELAARHSDDRNSAGNGGELPWFGTQRMIPQFEQAALALKPGEVSEPFSSNFGWHLVKLIDRKGIGSYEEMRPSLESKALSGDRSEEQQQLFYDKLKEKYTYTRNQPVYEKLFSVIDTSFFSGAWDTDDPLFSSQEVLFSIEDNTVSLGTFLTDLFQKPLPVPENSLNYTIEAKYNDYVEKFLMEKEKSKLPEKYPEYKYILQEYHDGILLFDIMDQEVWSKAVKDTTGLTAFYEANKNNYLWGERIEALIVSCDSTVDVQKVYKKASKISKGSWDAEKVNDKFCGSDSIPCVEIEKILVEKGSNDRVDALTEIPGKSAIYNEEGKFRFILATAVLPPQPKELKDTRGKVTSDYQDHLEKQWIDQLRKKYPVRVDYEIMKKMGD
jgi:peptidyl-prolyl cis-trans isomerase SurA